jgi:hypothetical protein
MESMPGFGNDDRAWGAAQGLGVYVAISRPKHALFVGCAAGKSEAEQSNFLLSNLFMLVDQAGRAETCCVNSERTRLISSSFIVWPMPG